MLGDAWLLNGALFLLNVLVFSTLWRATKREAPPRDGDYITFTHDQLRRWED